MYADALKNIPTHPNCLTWSPEELVTHTHSIHDLRRVAQENFDRLQEEIRNTFNIHGLLPYAGVTDVVLRDVIQSDIAMNHSQEELTAMFKNALLSLKNFFLNLWGSIVAFFKQLFDGNSRTRTTLYRAVAKFDKSRSKERDQKIMGMTLFLPNYNSAVDLCSNLDILYNDVVSLSDVPDIKTAAEFKKGIKLFGYDVKDGVIYQSIPYHIPTIRTTLSDGNWTIDGLKTVTSKVAMICTNAAELNKLKNSLENDVKSSIRNIDKYIAIGDNKKAEELQYALNNKSMRSSYVFKCSVIFQSYVTQISTMLVDAWNNILP